MHTILVRHNLTCKLTIFRLNYGRSLSELTNLQKKLFHHVSCLHQVIGDRVSGTHIAVIQLDKTVQSA